MMDNRDKATMILDAIIKLKEMEQQGSDVEKIITQLTRVKNEIDWEVEKEEAIANDEPTISYSVVATDIGYSSSTVNYMHIDQVKHYWYRYKMGDDRYSYRDGEEGKGWYHQSFGLILLAENWDNFCNGLTDDLQVSLNAETIIQFSREYSYD